MMDVLQPGSLLVIDAPWMVPLPRPLVDRAERPNPDPEQVAMQSAIVNAFDCRPVEPYSYAAVSVVITDADDVPAGGALKLVIDAVVRAGFIRDDRNDLLAARLTKAPLSVNTMPTVNVAVLERKVGDSTFIRELWPRRQIEPVSPVVGKAPSYSYVTGKPGSVRFQRSSTPTPESYRSHLQHVLRELHDRDSIVISGRMAASPFAGARLTVRIPMSGNFDPDNVLLYALDLVETARGQADDPRGLTIDQLVSEVVVFRSEEPGLQIHLYECDISDEEVYLPYFREGIDSITTGWPSEQDDQL